MKKWKKNKYKNALDKSERAQAPLNTVHGRVNGFPCDEKKNGKTKRKHETKNQQRLVKLEIRWRGE